jgi:hypothetical protein
VAEHPAGHRADRGALADAGAVLAAHLLERAGTRVPALLPLAAGGDLAALDHAREVTVSVTVAIAAQRLASLVVGLAPRLREGGGSQGREYRGNCDGNLLHLGPPE